MANPDFDELQATTLNFHRKVLADNFFCSTPFWAHLSKRRERKNGGLTIVEPILYAGNDHGRYYAGYDTLPISPFKNHTAIQNPWVQHSIPVSVCGFEENVNAGPEQVIALLQSKLKTTEKSVIRQWNYDAINGDASNPKALHGLAHLISDTPYGGIDPAVSGNEWHLPGVLDDGGYAAHIAGGGTDGNFAAPVLSFKRLTDLIIAIRDCENNPDLILVSRELWLGLLEVANGMGHLSTSKDMADLGFETIRYMGVDIAYDKDVPSGTAYILSMDAFKFWACGDKFMKFTGFQTPHNQDSRIAHMLTQFQLTTNERRAHGKLTHLKSAC